MPKELTAVNQIKELLRLGLPRLKSQQQIASHCGVSKSTVWEYVERAKAAGLDCASLEGMTDAQIWQKLGKTPPGPRPATRRLPDFQKVREELNGHKGTTLRLLWDEYREEDPHTAYQYTQYCEHYRRWCKTHKVTMRQEYRPGEYCFIDYAGETVPILDRATGEIAFRAQVFVGSLGMSNFVYTEATRTQGSQDWLTSNMHMLQYFGGVPLIGVPDNLKSAVKRAHRKRPLINQGYFEFSQHYGMVIDPARSRKPQDKASAEQAVQGIERWVLAPLRNERFYDLASLNVRMREGLDAYNDRPFTDREGTRREWFESYEKAALQALPATAYQPAEWQRLKISNDYHVRVDNKYYSVPYRHAGRLCDVKSTWDTVTVYIDGQREAIHQRIHRRERRYATNAAHLHPDHAHWSGWSTERLVSWAGNCGPDAEAYISAYIAVRRFPIQAFGGARGVLSLSKHYCPERFNAACALALARRRFGAQDVELILKRKLDMQQPQDEAELSLPQQHPNVRGETYYQ